MDYVKTTKLNQKFNGTEDLYRYLLKNVDKIEQIIGINIQKPLKLKNFCIVGHEKITERTILFYASNQDFPESLGELIVFAGAYNADIVVFFLQNTSENYLIPLNWLQKICTEDNEFIVVQAKF